MTFEPKSIADHIDCLARLTGAPDSFVGQVRELFLRKGISLEADASPYVRALEEAFQREESIRSSAKKARENVQRLQSSFNQMGESYAKQIEQLRRIQQSLGEQARRLRVHGDDGSRRKVRVRAKGSYVTRQQSDDTPLVPGPVDPQ